jgi:predicted DNA-binding protein (MmcQ/YjbR family)
MPARRAQKTKSAKQARQPAKVDAAALLQRLSKFCLALPEAIREDSGDFADFRVRKKAFAYFLNNHHGDQIVSVCCRAEMGENVDRASREPQRFYLPAYIGPRGWFGLRLDGSAVDWSEVRNLVELSYRLAAPKTLIKTLDATDVFKSK